MRTLALAFAALVLPMAAAQASMAAAVAPTARRAADPFVATCNTRKWGQSKKLPFNQRTEFCCAHWGFDKRKSQKNCDAVYTAYKALASVVANETLAAFKATSSTSGQNSAGSAPSISSVVVSSTNPSDVVFTFADGTALTASLAGLTTGGGLAGAQLNGTSLVISTEAGKTFSIDLATVLGSGGSGGSGAKAIAGLGPNPANASEILITFTDGTTQAVSAASLGGGKGLAGLVYDKMANALKASLADGTVVSASLDDLLAAAQQRAAGAGVASLGLNGNSLVITLSNGTQLSQDLSALISSSGSGSGSGTGGSGSNAGCAGGGSCLSSLGLSGNSLVVDLANGTRLTQDLSGVVSSGAAGKALSGLSYNPAIKSLVATLQDGTTVTGDLSSLSSGSGSGGLVPGGGAGLVTDNNAASNSDRFARTRCPAVGGVQLVVKSANCYCADASGNFETGNQAASRGVMIQQLSAAGDAVTAAGRPCSLSTPADAGKCIQAECQGTKWCAKMVLDVLCGAP